MIIGHPRRTNKVEIHERMRLNGSDIKRVKKTKSLIVIVDKGLNWEEQFKTVKGKVHGGLTSLIWSMPKKDFCIQLLRSGMKSQ